MNHSAPGNRLVLAPLSDVERTALVKLARDKSWRCCVLDLESVGVEQTLRELAACLAFPDYFGENLDALDECLRDMDSWVSEPGALLVLLKWDVAFKSNPQFFTILRRVFNDAVEFWCEEGKLDMRVVFDTEDFAQSGPNDVLPLLASDP